MSENILTEPGFVGWPNAYPDPPYIDHPSPNAAARLGAGYAPSPEFRAEHFACSSCNTINMSGSRSTDRNRLHAITGDPTNGRLRDYDCHHIYDFNYDDKSPQCSAQFILRKSHIASYNHAGGVEQYREHFGHGYDNAIEEFNAALAVPDVFRAPAVPLPLKEVESFERDYRPLPGWLRDIYLGGPAIDPAYRFEDGRLEYVQALAPLFSEGRLDCGIDTVFRAGVFGQEPLRDRFRHAMPFAFDPCGNIFFAEGGDVFFFDHETGSCEGVKAVGIDISIQQEPGDGHTYNPDEWSEDKNLLK